ncbi:MAG: DUF2264 domain-containing protein [Erythrobacter sp.]|jgi:hypothetical protein|nr:DUF2264 domain-containing protein [Erythrobacter sp.]
MRLLRQARTAAILARAAAREAPRWLRGRTFPRSAERLLDGVRKDEPSNEAYDDVVRYMALSWLTHRNAAGTGAEYPGQPSWSGRECDALEGFARMMPLFAAWRASGRPGRIEVDGHALDIAGEFRRGLLAGTDPASRHYWGNMPGRSNQRIVEAADIALAVWMLRGEVWDGLSSAEQGRIADWLAQAGDKAGLDNNWQLFFVLIDRVLASLGHPGRIEDPAGRYERVKGFYLGSGWFEDGPGGRVDYYNAWGFHYALAWIDRIDPAWDPAFLGEARRAFLADFRHFIGPRGFPAFGRSLAYRLAVAAPLVAGAGSDPDVVPPGEARRALDATWSHFVRHGALRRGRVTQGLHGPDMRLLEPYSGPASGLWSLRSLVMAYSHPATHAFWTAAPEPLPVERGDFERAIPALGWRLTGVRATGEITLHIAANRGNRPPPLPVLKRTDRWRCALGLMRRPEGFEAKYDAPSYSSARSFADKGPG